jgi:hypothetical protein
MTTEVVAVVGSLRAYAKHRKDLGLTGGSLAAVQKAIKSGRIQPVDGGIVFHEADKSWDANSDHRQQRRARSLEVPGHFQADPAMGGTFLEAQRRHEWVKVQKAELELKVKEGELWASDKVQEEWDALVTSTRSHLLLLPGKIAHKLAASAEPLECQAILDKAIKEALKSLSEFKLHAA